MKQATRARAGCCLGLAALCLGCGGATDPGGGQILVQLQGHKVPITLGADGAGGIDVTMLDPGSSQFGLARVRASDETDLDLSSVDWTDFAQNPLTALVPGRTVQVSGGNVYYLGLAGVTVVSLDGSAARYFFRPSGDPAYPRDMREYTGSFALDAGDAYVCYLADAGGPSTLGRFHDDGTWESLLTTGPLEDCYGYPIATDEGAVYWVTNHGVHRWSKVDGTDRMVLEFPAASTTAVFQLSVSGSSLLVDGASLWEVDKAGSTSLPDATVLLSLAPSEPAVYAMLSDAEGAYLLSQTQLRNVRVADGAVDVLADRPNPPGALWGLTTDGSKLYFLNVDVDGDTFTSTLRFVPK